MRFITRILLSSFLAVTFAYAQTIPPQTFSHIIIVIQENRTPDNIFGSTPKRGTNCTGEDPFETGVDIENGGYVCTSVSNGKCLAQQLICNISQPMNNGLIFDPGHFYEDWVKDYLDGGMNGFCHGFNPPTYCPTYSYVQKSDVQPYFDIAMGYGFANYMFQTNEGPSFPAHQFLFTGTSAPVAPSNNYYLDFVADNAPKPKGFADSGCPYDGNYGWPTWVNTDGSTVQPPPLLTECYTHDSLVTNVSGDKHVSWRYYTPTLGIIWDAPEGIPEVCYGQNKDVGGPCAGGEFTNNVKLPNEGPYDGAPILDDISTCNLQKISWVIPDQAWSDHPQFDGSRVPPYGPSWVGAIVNAVGNSYQNSLGKCDYWGYPAHQGTNPEPTAIFVVWDDWGGFFDHVPPPAVYEGTATTCPTSVQLNGWGCGYVYGFRVPLLVVSEYTQAGYVSGAISGPPTYPPPKRFTHDFGSILRFTEYNFGMPEIAPPYYADANTLDSANNNVPLSDFFSTSNQRSFTSIRTPYNPAVFRGYYTTLQNGVFPVPTGPDGTSGEEDQ
jgi:phospholipase C